MQEDSAEVDYSLESESSPESESLPVEIDDSLRPPELEGPDRLDGVSSLTVEIDDSLRAPPEEAELALEADSEEVDVSLR